MAGNERANCGGAGRAGTAAALGARHGPCTPREITAAGRVPRGTGPQLWGWLAAAPQQGQPQAHIPVPTGLVKRQQQQQSSHVSLAATAPSATQSHGGTVGTPVWFQSWRHRGKQLPPAPSTEEGLNQPRIPRGAGGPSPLSIPGLCLTSFAWKRESRPFPAPRRPGPEWPPLCGSCCHEPRSGNRKGRQ